MAERWRAGRTSGPRLQLLHPSVFHLPPSTCSFNANAQENERPSSSPPTRTAARNAEATHFFIPQIISRVRQIDLAEHRSFNGMHLKGTSDVHGKYCDAFWVYS